MCYPYDRLLRFFISRKVDINQTLERYGLPPVGGLWIANARSKIRSSAPYALTSYIDSRASGLVAREKVLDWANSQGFGDLWLIQKEFSGGPVPPDIDIALCVFMNPHARGTMGLLLMSGMPLKDIAEVFEQRYGVAITESVLEVYTRIFWDMSAMGRQGWEDFVPLLLTKYERHSIAMGLEDLPLDHVRDMVELGVTVEPEQVTSRVTAQASLMFERVMKQPNPEEDSVKMWADLALRAAKQLHDMKPKASESDKALPADGFQGLFSVQISKTTHPTLAELQGEVAQGQEQRQLEEEG